MNDNELAQMLDIIINLDQLIHQPTRLLILGTLYPVESADFLYLLRETRLTKGNLSAHISKLEQAVYIEVEKTYRGETPLTIYRLTEKGRHAFDAYRQQLRSLAAALPG
ncbi:transcriptional regulator [Chloroflexi bacterium TSY]|nr:transcriptional regulator [Chloroflexi bacterium TSY]